MYIVIHRMSAKDMNDSLKFLFDRFKRCGFACRALPRGGYIEFGNDVTIDFRCGDVFRMAGLRFDYYNVDSHPADDFLYQSATKYNAKKLDDLDDVFNHICAYLSGTMVQEKKTGEKEVYEIQLKGCDDNTVFSMELTNDEYELLKKVSEKANETSTYTCMPRMYIDKKGEKI